MDKAKTLMSELDEIDKKILENEEVLKSNNIDLASPLIDADGFPLAEVDVYSVRHARHNIICLQNDRKEKLAEIEKALVEAHASYSNGSSKRHGSSDDVHRTSNNPIARIGSVLDGSPAYNAQLKTDDLVIQFGHLHSDNFTSLSQFKDVVMASLNKVVKITVLRGIHVYRLELVPSHWSGEGVIGCTFLAAPR